MRCHFGQSFNKETVLLELNKQPNFTKFPIQMAPVSIRAGFKHRRPEFKSSSHKSTQEKETADSKVSGSACNRRQMALQVAIMGKLCWDLASWVGTADAVDAIDADNGYVDIEDGFTITVPSGWVKGSGMLGEGAASNKEASYRSRFSNGAGLQRLVAWVPPDTSVNDAAINLAVTVKTPAADYTSLGSFGSASDFGQNVVNMLDRSYLLKGPGWLRRTGDEDNLTLAKLLNATESKDRYLFQYTVSKAGSPTRIVYSAVAMGTSPSGKRRFYTVNASCPEANVDEYGAILQTAVQSFIPPPLKN